MTEDNMEEIAKQIMEQVGYAVVTSIMLTAVLFGILTAVNLHTLPMIIIATLWSSTLIGFWRVWVKNKVIRKIEELQYANFMLDA